MKFTLPSCSQFIKIRDGTELRDAVIIPNFMQNQLEADPQSIWDTLRSLSKHNNGNPIPFKGRVKWLEGRHPTLNYRGHAIKRNKIWLQDEYAKGYLKYGYTGWQWLVAPAVRPISKVPEVEELMHNLNMLGNFDFNHVIATLYENGDDNIGPHSDKIKDFANDSWFCVLKLGASRNFQFTDLAGNELYNEVLSAGAAIFVRANGENAANLIVKHAVPPMADCGPSGSLTFRNITTVVPWAQVRKEVAKRSQ